MKNKMYFPVWQQACQVKADEFTRLKSLTFKHLLSGG